MTSAKIRLPNPPFAFVCMWLSLLLPPSVIFHPMLDLKTASISIASPPLWNKLPPALRQLSDPSYELTKTSPHAISPQLFHSKLKTLLLHNSYPDSSSASYLPRRLNSKHHPPTLLKYKGPSIKDVRRGVWSNAGEGVNDLSYVRKLVFFHCFSML